MLLLEQQISDKSSSPTPADSRMQIHQLFSIDRHQFPGARSQAFRKEGRLQHVNILGIAGIPHSLARFFSFLVDFSQRGGGSNNRFSNPRPAESFLYRLSQRVFWSSPRPPPTRQRQPDNLFQCLCARILFS
jgi:hypothetical protein